MGYDRIRPSLDIESNLKSGIVRGGRSNERIWLDGRDQHRRQEDEHSEAAPETADIKPMYAEPANKLLAKENH